MNDKTLIKIGKRFIKLKPHSKVPVSQWRRSENQHPFQEVGEWLRRGFNYGIVCGNHLVVLDADTSELEKAVRERLPQTLEVRTGSGGCHFYFMVDKENPKKVVFQKGEKHYGELQGEGSYVVGPYSVHPNGKPYEIIRGEKIAEVPYEHILTMLADFLDLKTPSLEREAIKAEGIEVQLTDLINTAGFTRLGNGELIGPHPIHGSSTGHNFTIDPIRNIWHCFRHNSGGNWISYLAMAEGLVDCSQAGHLDKETLKKTLYVAKRKGLIPDTRSKEEEKDRGDISSGEIELDFQKPEREGHFRLYDLKPGDYHIPFWSSGRIRTSKGIREVPSILGFLTPAGIFTYKDFNINNLPKIPNVISFSPYAIKEVWLFLKASQVEKVEIVEMFSNTAKVEEENEKNTHFVDISRDSRLIKYIKERKERISLILERFKVKNLPPQTNLDKSTSLLTLQQALEYVYKVYQAILEHFIDYDQRTYEAKVHALWSLGTYFYPIFNVYPYLYLTGLKSSGKTKLLNLLRHLSFMGVSFGSFTASSVTRFVNAYATSLFLDEAEALSNPKNKPEIYALLLNSYKKVAHTTKTKETRHGGLKSFEPEFLVTYCPLALANIHGLGEVLESRTIDTLMLRARDKVKSNRDLTPEWDELFEELADLLLPLVILSFEDIQKIYNRLENETSFSNRDFEIWKPLLSLAKYISEDTYQEIKQIAEYKSAEKKAREQEHTELKILNIIYSLGLEGWKGLSEIVKKLKEWDPEEFSWIRERRLSNILRRFGFTETRLVNGRTQIKISRSILEENLERFGIKRLNEETPQTNPTPPENHRAEDLLAPMQAPPSLSNLSGVTSGLGEGPPGSNAPKSKSKSKSVEDILKSPEKELQKLGVVEC